MADFVPIRVYPINQMVMIFFNFGVRYGNVWLWNMTRMMELNNLLDNMLNNFHLMADVA